MRDPVVVQASLPRFLAPGDTTRLRLDLAHASGPAGRGRGDARPPRTRACCRRAAPSPARSTTAAGWSSTRRSPAVAPGDYALTVETVTPGGEHLTKRADGAGAGQRPRARAPGPDRARRRPDAHPRRRRPRRPRARHGRMRRVAIGPLAAFDVPGLLTALEAYPWGCTEQIVSRAMPLLYFAATAEGLGHRRARPTIEARLDEGDPRRPRQPDRHRRLRPLERRGERRRLARRLRHRLPLPRAGAGARGARTAPSRRRSATSTNLVNAYGDFEKGGEDLAYALMVLAREGRAAIGDLRYYADTRADAFATPLAQAQLGAALALAGDQPRADAMFRRAGARGRRRASRSSSTAPTTAAVRATPPACSRSPPRPAATRSTAQALAARRHGARRRALDPGAALDAPRRPRAGGRRGARLAAASNDAPAPGPALRLAPADLPLRVTNTGAEPTLAVVTAFGVPTQPEPAQGNGYRIERQLLTLDGAPADPAAIALNDRLVAVVTVTPERDLQARLIVSDPLPAGLEIENPNLLRSGETGQLAWLAADDVATHAEFRADRFAAAVDWQGAAAVPPRLHGARRLAGQLPPPGRERRGHVPPGLPRPHRRRHGHGARGAMTRRRAALARGGAGARRRRRSRLRPLGRRDGRCRRSRRRPRPSSSTATARCSRAYTVADGRWRLPVDARRRRPRLSRPARRLRGPALPQPPRRRSARARPRRAASRSPRAASSPAARR